MNVERLDELINGWLDGAATDAEHAELEACLLGSGAARARFWQLTTFHGLAAEAAKLRWGVPDHSILAADPANSATGAEPSPSSSAHAGAAAQTDKGVPKQPSPLPLPLLERLGDWIAGQSSSPRALAAIVAVGLATYFGSLLLPVIWQQAWKRAQQADAPELSAQPQLTQVEPSGTIAKLVHADRCQWEDGVTPLAIGDPVGPGPLHLLAGTAEFEFLEGARVRIHGPTSFELQSTSLGFLEQGRLAARVPQRARGFTIETPTARLIDLGTAFVVEVNQAAETRMAVTEGTVQVLPAISAAGEPRNYAEVGAAHRLTLGQAITIARTDAGSTVATAAPFDSAWVNRNLPPGELLQLSPAAEAQDTYYESLIHTPDLIACWRLAELGGQLARDEIGHESNPAGLAPGTYHHMQAADFRQPGALKSANSASLRFDGAGYVEVADRGRRLIGDWDGLTVLAWVNPADSNASDSRMIAGTWAQAVTQDQFALWHSAEKLGFSIADGQLPETGSYSAGKVPLASGKWSFVAGTWDKATGAVHLYVNGQDDTPADARQAGSGINQNSTASFCIGSQVGKSRFFVGLLEEVAVFKRCLSPREIGQLFTAGTVPAAAVTVPVGGTPK